MDDTKITLLQTLVNASTANKITVAGRLADITPFTENSEKLSAICRNVKKSIIDRHGFFNPMDEFSFLILHFLPSNECCSRSLIGVEDNYDILGTIQRKVLKDADIVFEVRLILQQGYPNMLITKGMRPQKDTLFYCQDEGVDTKLLASFRKQPLFVMLTVSVAP